MPNLNLESERADNNKFVGIDFLENKVGGKHLVSSSLFELYPFLGSKYNHQSLDAEEILEILKTADISEEELNTVVNVIADIELSSKGSYNKEETQRQINENPKLKPIREKLRRAYSVEALAS